MRIENTKFLERIPVWLRGWTGVWALVAGIYVLIYSAWILFLVNWTDPAYVGLIAGLGYLPLGIFSAGSSIYTATRKNLEIATRRAWQFIAFGVICLSLADILYVSFELSSRGVGFPDIPDIFYLAYYPLAFFGLITIPSQVYDPSQEKTWKTDLGIVVISTSALAWYYIIAPTAVAGGEDFMSRLVAGAYPAMDILLLSSIFIILFRKSEINARRSLFILGIGILVYVIADIAYAWQVLLETYVSGSWVDIFWTVSYLFIGLAAYRQANPYLKEVPEEKTKSTWQASLMPFVGVGICLVASFYAASTGIGTGIRTDGLIIGTALSILLLIIRQITTIRENSRLVEELHQATAQLQASARSLEERVVERTRDLESQTSKLQLAAQIAKDVASSNSLENLLNRSTDLILNRFNLYHAAIYMLDSRREYLVQMSSSNRDESKVAGDVQRFRMGDGSMVSTVIVTGDPNIQLEVEMTDAYRFHNLFLSETRSEMALPLSVENNTIGVLDLHSDKAQAFDRDDIVIMQVLADQLATTIERTRLLQQVEKNLSELERTYEQFTREGWKALSDTGVLSKVGYRFDNVRLQAINDVPEAGEKAIAKGSIVVTGKGDSSKKNVVSIPIKLRGQAIGVVSAELKDDYTQNTISTLQLAIERLAVSLESARLYEEARLRVDRELRIAQVTSSISAANDFDSILRTTVEEVGKSLGNAEISIQIIGEAAS
jgi:GAF domain-containing protein